MRGCCCILLGLSLVILALVLDPLAHTTLAPWLASPISSFGWPNPPLEQLRLLLGTSPLSPEILPRIDMFTSVHWVPQTLAVVGKVETSGSESEALLFFSKQHPSAKETQS